MTLRRLFSSLLPRLATAAGVSLPILATGIQDLAVLIPILSTELCAHHTTKALEKGLLYAAATPLTIFGSLGIAKAGFIALVASIDCPFFHGPTILKNAGFHPSGLGKLFLHVKHNKHHLYKAEGVKPSYKKLCRSYTANTVSSATTSYTQAKLKPISGQDASRPLQCDPKASIEDQLPSSLFVSLANLRRGRIPWHSPGAQWGILSHRRGVRLGMSPEVPGSLEQPSGEDFLVYGETHFGSRGRLQRRPEA